MPKSDGIRLLLKLGSKRLSDTGGVLEHTSHVLVDGEGDGLAGGNSHDSGSDTLVQSSETLLVDELSGDSSESGETRLVSSGGSTLSLHSGLDGIDGGVRKGTQGTGDQTDDGSLPRGKDTLELGLHLVKSGLELRVDSEVNTLVGGLSGGSENHTSVQSRGTLLSNNGVETVSSVSVLGDIEGISHGVVLGLESDLDDLSGVDDQNSFGGSGTNTGNESVESTDGSIRLGQKTSVVLVRGESDGHLGHNTGHNGSETLVKSQRTLLLGNVNTSLDESDLLNAVLSVGELHSHLDGVKRMADQGLKQTGGSSSQEINSEVLLLLSVSSHFESV
jgi:hypothetical protein